MTAIHQFVATAEAGAVGQHILEVQRAIRELLGLRSEIFTEFAHPPFVGTARDYRDYGTAVKADPGDLLVYQMAIGSVVADFLADRPERLVLNYHNLTPVRYLNSWDPDATHGVKWGFRQLEQMADRVSLAIAVSRYNESDLRRAGYRNTTVVPVLSDVEAHGPRNERRDRVERSEEPSDRNGRGRGREWLFVGRLSAHKCQHLIVRALAVYRRLYDPDAHLTLVGGPLEGRYVDALRAYIRSLGLESAVTLTGPVSDDTLGRHYRRADAFVCLSEHEGFCVPLVEAMWHGVPVVTLRSSAIPETVGAAGIVLPGHAGVQPDAAVVAAAVHAIAADPALRRRLVAAGDIRSQSFSLERTRLQMCDVLRKAAALS